MKNFVLENIKQLSFFQLLRLLKIESNEDINVLIKKLNVYPHLSLSFSKSDMENIEFDKTYNIAANFLTTYGVSSVLPTFYTEDLISQHQQNNNSLRTFYNLFNKRTYQLFAQLLLTENLMLRIFEFKDQTSLDFIKSFIGLHYTNEKLKNYTDFELLQYIHILNETHKSSDMLETLLRNVLHTDVNIKEGMQKREKIPEDQLFSLKGANSRLGLITLGKTINTISKNFQISLNELTLDELHLLLPGQNNFNLLQETVDIFFGKIYKNYSIEYVLSKKEKAPKLQLGTSKIHLGMNFALGSNSKNYVYEAN